MVDPWSGVTISGMIAIGIANLAVMASSRMEVKDRRRRILLLVSGISGAVGAGLILYVILS